MKIKLIASILIVLLISSFSSIGITVIENTDNSSKNILNNPPGTPEKPSGSTSGTVGTQYSYTTRSTDPDGDRIQIIFDWGDQATSTTNFVDSGQSVSASHEWVTTGSFQVRAKARDINGAESSWSAALIVVISSNNNAPNPPTVSGQSSGEAGTSYTYYASTTDPNGDNIAYKFDWGDGSYSDWTDYAPSGTSMSVTHSWETAGSYSIRAKARDIGGSESAWGPPLIVSMPKITIKSVVNEIFPFLSKNPIPFSEMIKFFLTLNHLVPYSCDF